MQNTEKNSNKSPKKPSASDYGKITDLVIEMQTDYDNGLREFQEAIHYAIGIMSMVPEDEIVFDDRTSNVCYLMDLSRRLRKMESYLPNKTISHE